MPTAKKKATKAAGDPRDIRAVYRKSQLYTGSSPAPSISLSAMRRIGWRGHAIIGFARPVLMAAPIQFRFGDSGWMVLSISAPPSRKARNLARNPAVSVHLDSGDDRVILEGTVVEVSCGAVLAWTE